MEVGTESDRRSERITIAIVVLGIVLTFFLWTRSQIAGDQLNMLSRGWLLVAEGEWVPFGQPTSAGGKQPGGFTAILVGLPLWFWQHHRASTLLIVVVNLLGYLLLDRIVYREMGARARLLFAIVYWLNPWRFYHSGFLWNPNYLMPLGAVHFWSIYRQRQRPEFWASFWQVLAIGLLAQTHASVATLVLLSLLLWWRGYFRFHWPAVALATGLVAISLLPWISTILADPATLPAGASRHGRLAQSALSMARGLGYWLRYPALIGSSTILCLDFGSLPPLLTGDSLRKGVQVAVGLFTVPLTVWANLNLWRRAGRWWARPTTEADFQSWLTGVLRWSFVGVLLVTAITPTAVMSWQLLTIFHLAVLPMVILGLSRAALDRPRATRYTASVYASLCLALTLAIGWGSPMFRCGGETCGAMNTSHPPLRSNHEMLDALGINATCQWEVDVPGGWWPDVLPER